MEYIKTIEAEYLPSHAVSFPVEVIQPANERQPFIVANTVEGILHEIQNTHLIPVFVKDNTPLISHGEFIACMQEVATEFFNGLRMMPPAIRLSHEIKGRIPSARDKPANLLAEWEKTIYYERMMFCIELPDIHDIVDGNLLHLTIGGVKSYTQDNLYSKKGDEHFKVFIGFKNQVCANLCVWTDGLLNDLKVTNAGQLKACIHSMLKSYNQNLHLYHLKKFSEHFITEPQFAHLIGRCRMHNHLPTAIRNSIPTVLFGDQQMNTVVKDFYKDKSFSRDRNGNINLWKLHNLFTGTNKSSYIDSFLDRSVNAHNFVEQICWAIEGKNTNWYVN